MLIYLMVNSRTSKKPNLTDAISLLTSNVGLLTGIKVCWFAYLYREVAPIKEISLQTFVGGIAIGWVSIATAIKKFHDN